MQELRIARVALVVLGVGVLIGAAPATAADARRAGPDPERRERRLAEFDTDGDGELSDAEREVAREALIERSISRHPEEYDTNGDGELSEAEREVARDAKRARMGERRARALEKFDADGDGRLSEEERRAAFESRHGTHRRKGEGGGQRGERKSGGPDR